MKASASRSPRSKRRSRPRPPVVGVIMGSTSDWETMRHTVEMLERFDVPYESFVVSAHRTPQWLASYASKAEKKGLQILIAGAGGAAHLPGMAAAQTLLPVLGVPIESKALKGLDSLLSIAQMPAGIPVGTLAVGRAGAVNAGLLAIAILARHDVVLRKRLAAWRSVQTRSVMQNRELPPMTEASRSAAKPPSRGARSRRS